MSDCIIATIPYNYVNTPILVVNFQYDSLVFTSYLPAHVALIGTLIAPPTHVDVSSTVWEYPATQPALKALLASGRGGDSYLAIIAGGGLKSFHWL